MKTMLRAMLLIAASLLAGSSSMIAHHSGQNFDEKNLVVLTGTVTEFKMMNPHVHFLINVKTADGRIEKWLAESDSPQNLYNRGWKRDTLKPGDQIKITGALARDGSKIVRVKKIEGRNLPPLSD